LSTIQLYDNSVLPAPDTKPPSKPGMFVKNVGKDGLVTFGFSIPMLVPDIADDFNKADGIKGNPNIGPSGRKLLNMTEIDVQRDIINF